MSHEYTLERLDDWTAGELPVAEARAVDAHLDACAQCRAEADALRRLLDEVAALPAEVAPPRDLWAGIAARIEAPAPAAVEEKVIPITRARGWRPPQWVQMAAAAVVLVVSSSLVTLQFAGSRGDAAVQPVAQAPVQQAPAQQAAPASPPITALAAFRPAEEDFETAIADLQRTLASRRGTLAPETVQTLETNLRIIDEAIRQSRAALERDPNSRELTDMLSSAYGQKMAVLRQAVEL
jgi:anti-sigma factor RsiW